MYAAEKLKNRLEEHKSKGLERTFLQPMGIDFSSNDYLGFAHDPILRERFCARLQTFPVGSTGSRLLRGNLALYEETEDLLAKFVGREAALLFPSGYTANIALLSALLGPEDYVFSDAFNHASIIDGVRLSGAQKKIFPHRNYDHLAEQLTEHQDKAHLQVIVTESLFSMEGTMADMHRLVFLAKKFGALLIVDEAHSTGLWGSSLVATLGLSDQVFATIHPAGKALGASGAWIAGSYFLRDYLAHFARAFMFSTAPLPALPLLLQEAIKFYMEVGYARADIVKDRACQLRGLLNFPAHYLQKNSLEESPIVSVFLKRNKCAIEANQCLQARGWDVRAIRPPTVPDGTARLRITVKWENTEKQLEELARDIAKIL